MSTKIVEKKGESRVEGHVEVSSSWFTYRRKGVLDSGSGRPGEEVVDDPSYGRNVNLRVKMVPNREDEEPRLWDWRETRGSGSPMFDEGCQ